MPHVTHPPFQLRPSSCCRPSGCLPRTHRFAYSARRQSLHPEQPKRPRYRWRREQPSADDPARDHEDHRRAALALVAPRRDDDRFRPAPAFERTSHLPLAQPVAVQDQTTSGLTTRTLAARTRRRPRVIHRRHVVHPVLEIGVTVYESDRAPVLHSKRCGARRAGASTPPANFRRRTSRSAPLLSRR